MIYRTLRIMLNSISFFICLYLAFTSNDPIFIATMLLASFDQFEDVLFYAYGIRIIPKSLKWLDIFFEAVMVVLGFFIFLISLTYIPLFPIPFWYLTMFISIMIMYTSIEDIVIYMKTPYFFTKE